MRPAVLNVLLAISPSTVLGRTLKDFKDLKDGEIIPGRYLVEFEDTQSTFQENVKAQKLLAGAPLVTISSSLFNGASYQFDDSQLDNDGISTLSSLPSVKNIWPVRAFKVPDDEIHWTGENPSAQVSTTSDSKKNTTGYSPHVLTQVDRLQAEGLTGKGIKVGIIDTGIDYKHPALGGCFGPNCLVSHGYDYIGEGNANYGEPDDDPYTECQGHGTHVAGIVAAQQNKYGFLGAAPGVKLGMYRVFDCNGYTGSDLIVAGMLRAFEDGNHIVSASLGGPGGWAEHPMAVVADRLAAEGVIW